MEVPKKIVVDVSLNESTRSHQPAGYETDESDYDYDSDPDYVPPRPKVEPTARLMSPPEKLTIPEISDEERRRFLRESSFTGNNVPYLPTEESMYKTPNDTVLKNMNSFQSGDPVSIGRQVRHLHNRVRLLEEELQTQHNRQIFLIGLVSAFIIFRSIKWVGS